jgi:Uma2 family endonuclease
VTAVPQPWGHLLTVAEYAELGETESGYTELLEGRLLMSPSPVPDHNVAAAELLVQLRPQLPEQLEVIPDVDVDLQLAAPDQPGFSRRPDLVIGSRAARARVRTEGGLIRAGEVLIVVEVVSPGSRRTDYITKRGEYADAGIPHYWIVDLDKPVSLVDCHLPEGFGYQDGGSITDVFTTTEPFPIRLRLDRLLRSIGGPCPGWSSHPARRV